MMAWAVLRVVRRVPAATRARQIAGTADAILDLSDDVDPERDHIRGPEDAPVTLIEYGDFQCTFCGQAEDVIREVMTSFDDDVRYVWRHLPLNDVHRHAQMAAEASEAAAAQGDFWGMHDILLNHQGELRPADVARYAGQLGLDAERLIDELRRREYAPRISEDVASADESGRVRHADVLCQRTAPLRPLRHRHAHRHRPIGPEPFARAGARLKDRSTGIRTGASPVRASGPPA